MSNLKYFSGKDTIMSKNKQKSNNQNVPFYDDQLGENKNSNGGGKKEQGGRKANK